MKRATKARLAAGLTAGAMMFSVAAPAFAAPPVQATTGNLIAVLNNVTVDITNVQVVDVDNSLNNNRVNVNVLQNILNRNDINVNVEDVLQNFLNANKIDVNVGDVIIQGIVIDGNTLFILI